MKREPYPDPNPKDTHLVAYYLANAEHTRALCRELGYGINAQAARPPKGKRSLTAPADNVVPFPPPTPPAPPIAPPPPPLLSIVEESNVPKSDSSGAGAP